MSYQFKSFQISLAFHALLMLIIFTADMSSSSPPRGNLMVIDFTIEESTNAGPETSHDTISKPKPRLKVSELKHRIKNRNPETEKKRIEVQESKDEVILPVTQSKKEETLVEAQMPVLDQIEEGKEYNSKEHIITASETTGGLFGKGGERGVLGDDNVVTSDIGWGRPYGHGKINYLKENFSYIKDMIQKRITYPRLARRMGWEGKVKVSFIITSNGHAKDIKVTGSSGREVLDRSAREAVKDASPFPKPPIEAQIIIPIVYRLN